MANRKLTGLAEPTASQDAATKNYVDLAVQGLAPKASVRAASTANIATLSGPMTLDGVALVAGNRVLVKDQATASQNGIYVVAAGAWARSADADTWVELVSAYVFVESGTVNADMGYLSTVDPGGTLGTTAVTFVQFTGAGQILAGAGLTKSGNTLDVGAGTGIAVAADTVGLTGQALAVHNLATNGLVARTAVATMAARAIAVSGTGLSVSNGDAVAGNPTLSLTAALASVGGLTPIADRLAYYTGASTAALVSLTAFARTLLDDADAATARSTLGLGTLASQSSASVAITGGTIDGIALDGGTF
jgi:phage-related tail fiber protein